MVDRFYSALDQGRRTLRLFQSVGLNSGFRSLRVFSEAAPYTMVGRKRLEALYRLARSVETRGVPGDLVECGVCNGGTAAVLAAAGLPGNATRRLWLFDSFEGLPPASPVDGERAQAFTGKCLGQVESVRQVLQRVRAPMDRVEIVQGWFQDTFPSAQVPAIALLHIDADWYESVKLCLDRFYPLVQPGGLVVFDDYGFWEGCKKAVDKFLSTLDAPPALERIDSRGVYLTKPG